MDQQTDRDARCAETLVGHAVDHRPFHEARDTETLLHFMAVSARACTVRQPTVIVMDEAHTTSPSAAPETTRTVRMDVARPVHRSLSAAVAVLVVGTALAIYVWSTSSPTRGRSASGSASIGKSPSATIVKAPSPQPASSIATVPPAAAGVASPTRSASVERGTCSLRIDADIPGSVVLIDGQASGTAPLQVDGLRCGRRMRVTVARAEFAPWERWIVPEEGKRVTLQANLGRLTTALAVTSSPVGAMVRINGRETTTTPAAIPIAVGSKARIEIALPGYTTFKQTIVPRAGRTTTIDAVLVSQR